MLVELSCVEWRWWSGVVLVESSCDGGVEWNGVELSCDGGVELCWWILVASSCDDGMKWSCVGRVELSQVVMVDWRCVG